MEETLLTATAPKMETATAMKEEMKEVMEEMEMNRWEEEEEEEVGEVDLRTKERGEKLEKGKGTKV